jgi:transcription elongation factor GreA
MTKFGQLTGVALTSDGVELLKDRIRTLRDVTMPSYRPLLVEHDRDERIVAEFERLQGEVNELEALVASSVVIDADDSPKDGVARLGSRVLLEMPDGKEFVRIVHSAEAFLDDERISSSSPLAKSVLGARVGEIVEVDAPRGTWSAKLLEVDGVKPERRRRGR